MAFDTHVKAAARRAFVFDRLSLEQVAERLGVAFSTLRRWKKEAETQGDDWEKVREAHIMAGGDVEAVAKGLLAGFLVQYKTVMNELENADLAPSDKVQQLGCLADSFAKMTASSKKLLPTTSEIATAMRVIELLAEEIKTQKPTLLGEFLPLLDGLEARLQKEFK